MKTIIKRMPKRFLEGAPDYVLDIFRDHNFMDQWSVFFGKDHIVHMKRDGSLHVGADGPRNTYIDYVSMSANPFHPQGVGLTDSILLYQFRRIRERDRRKRIPWSELPELCKKCVRQIAEVESQDSVEA